MQPIVYAYDLGKAEGRKAWLAFFLGVAIAAAGLVMTYGYGLQALGRGVVAGAVIPS